MAYLIVMTFVWAFSFPLIGYYLSGQVDDAFSILVRFLLAWIIFLPFMNFKTLPYKIQLQLMGIGAIQIGLMYQFYYAAFLYLSVSEVALFTIFTPIYVSLFYDLCNHQFRLLYLISAALAVLGAYVIRAHSIDSDFIVGFLLVQGANICFGTGQSFYKALIEKHQEYDQKSIFGYFYLGALCVGFIVFVWQGDFEKMPTTLTQWLVLVYLGVIASGAGYFCWNKGASLVDSGMLAIMNNAIIPVAIIINYCFWGQTNDLMKLLLGGAIIGASMLLHAKFMKIYQLKHD